MDNGSQNESRRSACLAEGDWLEHNWLKSDRPLQRFEIDIPLVPNRLAKQLSEGLISSHVYVTKLFFFLKNLINCTLKLIAT